jgi:BCD family chlorophyll transporter-like MFS transporter
MIDAIARNPQATRFFWYLIILLAAILGQDILLEPYAAEAFDMSVKTTTRITSIWGVCVLTGLVIAGWLETRFAKKKTATIGGWLATFGFIQITISGGFVSITGFYAGVILLGVGTGLSTVANLSLMLDMTMDGQVGLFVGAWGMANAISRLVGSVIGGATRDLVKQIIGNPLIAYGLVFSIMVVFLLISLFMLRSIDIDEFRAKAQQHSIVERAALAADVS